MVRRVVTGVDPSGKPVIASDGEPPVTRQYVHTPGFARSLVWHTAAPAAASNDPTQDLKSYIPAPGETIALTVTFPPAGVYADPGWNPEAAGAEQLEATPGLAELFEAGSSSIRAEPRHFVFRYRSPEHFVAVFKDTYGPTLKAFAALDVPKQQALTEDLLQLIARFNRASDGTMVVPGEYLEVVVTRR